MLWQFEIIANTGPYRAGNFNKRSKGLGLTPLDSLYMIAYLGLMVTYGLTLLFHEI